MRNKIRRDFHRTQLVGGSSINSQNESPFRVSAAGGTKREVVSVTSERKTVNIRLARERCT
jgi:hypothetical protein